MTKCRKSFMPECEYFVMGGCVSPFNCSYKAEESITTATSTPCNLYPLETDKDKEIARLTAENAELRATLSKMGTVEKELRARLEKAVELPCKEGDTVYEKGMYEGDVYEHRIRKIIFDAEKISFDCTAIGNSIFLTRAEAEARLQEIKEENDD